jgi:hypothetical protein
MTEGTSAPALNPWRPMRDPLDLKHLGKFGEELGEAGAAVSRCIIQGVEECEPVTGKPNREWLEEEIADVLANADLVVGHFRLNGGRIEARRIAKRNRLREWHAMADDPVGCAEREVGRWVYRRIEAVISAKPGTAEGRELAYLAAVAADVEEYGATGEHPVSIDAP